MAVKQHILNWLYSVLTSDYRDVNRTYRDVVEVLERYPNLSPRTDIYTFPNGTAVLLLRLTGTLPVQFRGVVYRFPVSVWVPHTYPREPPLTYVEPSKGMTVRPGQHVDPQGQIYHPYLNHWPSMWDKSTIADLIVILSDIFSKEPPVIAQPQAPETPSIVSSATTSQPRLDPRASMNIGPGPPAPPPPPVPPMASQGRIPLGQDRTSAHPPTPSPPYPTSRLPTHFSRPPGPPPPPKEGGVQAASMEPSRGGGLAPSPSSGLPFRQNTPVSRYDRLPSLPPGPQLGPQTAGPGPRLPQPHAQDSFRPDLGASQTRGDSAQGLPYARNHGSSLFSYQSPPPFQTHLAAAKHAAVEAPRQLTVAWQSPSPYDAHHGHFQTSRAGNLPPPQATKPVHPLDLLDAPVADHDQAPTTSPAVPPVPPNPERDNMVRQIGQALFGMRQASLKQDEMSLSGLAAQRTALAVAAAKMQTELGELHQLSQLLASNSSILHDAQHKADAVMDRSKNHAGVDIDELLVPRTVVASQLYTLVAEERAIGDAIYSLSRAMEKGRVSTPVFIKLTRSLAREWFLKKALIQKIAEGMGLATERRS